MGKTAVAVCGLLCFCGLLRIGEALQLTWEDLVFPDQHRSGYFIVVMLKLPKRAAKDTEKVYLTNHILIKLVLQFRSMSTCKAQEKVFNFSYTTFSYWFQKGLGILGFGDSNFRSHSMRRGGATLLALKHATLKQICDAGRWANEKTARLYVQKGEVLLLRLKANVSDLAWKAIVDMAALLARLDLAMSG